MSWSKAKRQSRLLGQETQGEDQNGLGWQLKKSEVTQLQSLLGMRKNNLAVSEQVEVTGLMIKS